MLEKLKTRYTTEADDVREKLERALGMKKGDAGIEDQPASMLQNDVFRYYYPLSKTSCLQKEDAQGVTAAKRMSLCRG